MILDTSFLIDVLRGSDAVREWERELDETGKGVVTAITVMELWEGIHLADATADERSRVRELLEGLRTAPFDDNSGRVAGEFSAKLTADGTPIDIEDVMIAAIARRENEPILTGNPDHFDQVPGVDVESY